MKKVMLIFGTRPEAIKMCPLVKEFQKDTINFKTVVCVTAQHREMLDQVLHVFDVKPEYDLNIMKQGQDLYDITSRVLLGLRDVLKKELPDIVLVHGDTTTSSAAALAAFYQQIPVGHVEAGLRTHNIYSPWPEEMNRQITSRIAVFHFAPTELSRRNLQREGVADGNIYDTRYDGVNLTFGKEVKLEAFYGKPTNSFKNWGFDKIYGARVNGKIGALNAEAGWTKFEGDATPITSDDDSIWNVGATYNFSDKASLGVMYLRSDVEDLEGDKDGFVVTGTLGGAKASKPGSVGLVAKYYQQAAGTAIQHTMNGEYGPTYSGEGFKGYSVAGYYTVAKNMIAGIEYYDLKQTYSDDKMKTLWSQLIVTF